MPKARILPSGFWDDPGVGRLSITERLLLAGMITRCADDMGRLRADAGYLRKEVFGYDDFTRDDVAAMVAHILEMYPAARPYTSGGQEYIWLANWEVEQAIRHVVKSKLPPHPDEPAPDAETSPQIAENFRKVRKTSAVVEGGRVEESRVEGGGVGDAENPGPPDVYASQETATPPPGADGETVAQLAASFPMPDGVDPPIWTWFLGEVVARARFARRDPALMLGPDGIDLAADIRAWRNKDPAKRGELKSWLGNKIGFWLKDNPVGAPVKGGINGRPQGQVASRAGTDGPGGAGVYPGTPTPELIAAENDKLDEWINQASA